MQHEFVLKVSFRQAMTGPEQNMFWNSMSNCLKNISAYGGGSQDVFSLNWNIDYSRTSLDEFSVKKHIATFLEQQFDIVGDFSFYKK